MQRARNRCRGEREDVRLELQLLEALLMLHAEPMLLVHDDDAQLVELHVGAEQPVSANDDVDLLLRQCGERFGLLLCGLKATQHRDAYGKVGEPLGERSRVLVGQNGRGHEHRHLPATLHRLERRAHRNLRLAVSDVADEQAVHGTHALHVLLYVGRGLALIGRVLEEEAALELSLPRGIRNVRRPRRHLAARIEIEELDRHLLNGRARPVALLRPPLSAKPVQARWRSVLADVVGGTVTLELVDTVQRHVEPVAALVLDDRDLDGALAEEDRLDPAIDADAVLQMDDDVARVERETIPASADVTPTAPDTTLATKDFMVGENAQAGIAIAGGNEPPSAQRTDDERGRREVAHAFIEQLVQALALSFVVAEDDRGKSVTHQPTQALDVAVDGLRRSQRERDVGLFRRRIHETDPPQRRQRRRGLLT